MKQEEFEGSDELRELLSVSDEVSQYRARIAELQGKGTMEAGEELANTVMPLLEDLALAVSRQASVMEEWVANVEEDMRGSPPDLTPGELELFKFLLSRFSEIVSGMKGAPDVAPPVFQGLLELEVKISLANEVLERLSTDEETEEEEDPDEDDGDADDDD